MKHIKIISQSNINRSAHTGCGECQSSCQSACKTSCTIANQTCVNPRIKGVKDKDIK